MKPNPVREKSYVFAVDVVLLSGELAGARQFVLANQVLRAGTSVGANVEEALAGQSRRDFRSKMAIASKEAREAHYWLRLLRDGEIVHHERVHDMLQRCEELVRLLTAIVKSSGPR